MKNLANLLKIVKIDIILFEIELPDLPDEELPHIPGPSEVSARRQENKPSESSFDPSDSLISTFDGESSAIITLNPPTKRTKLSEVIFSSGEEDEVLGNIQPFQNSITNYLQKEDPYKDPGSPLDRSTPISEFDEEETQVFSVNNNPETITKQINNIVSAESPPSVTTPTAASSKQPVASYSQSSQPIEMSRTSTRTYSSPPPVNPMFR